jgi:Tfp pilus assembly protein PilE
MFNSKERELAANDFEILVVRKSGPVQNMTIKKWWISFVLIVVLLIAAVLAVGSYMFYRQYVLVKKILDDNSLLALRTERLEGLMLEQETREILLRQQAQNSGRSSAQQVDLLPSPSEETHAATDEPTTSSVLDVRNMEQWVEQGDLRISFDIINEDDSEPVTGYIAVVAHGSREGNPSWVEAWPPMRLNSSGRPEQYRRGTPFSLQYFRTIHARLPIADKTFSQLDLLLYSRQGELILVKSYPVIMPEQSAGQ